MLKCYVIESYQSAYPNPVKFCVGDDVSVGIKDYEYPGWIRVTTTCGNEGWAPEWYIDQTSQPAKAIYDYDATELTVVVGQRLTLHHFLNSWVWAETECHQLGWLPSACLDYKELEN